eukprot:jgi/Bigna1/76402/fgenesh1_pg.41_\
MADKVRGVRVEIERRGVGGHGESIANVDPAAYKCMPDHKLPLTERGEKMAENAGRALDEQFKQMFGTPEKMGLCRMWVSPFKRTRQTADGILTTAAGDWIHDVKESPFLVEQDWGLFEGSGMEDGKEKYPVEWGRMQRLREHQGKYWARMPMGESCFDVCTRVANLFETITRDRLPKWSVGRDSVENVIIVSHGVTIRAFIMMWCHLSPEWFEVNMNPPNCSIIRIDDSECKGYVFGGYNCDEDGLPVALEDVEIKDDPRLLGTEATMCAAF